MRALCIFVLAAAMLTLLGACSSTKRTRAAEPAVTVMADDAGRTITLARGQELIVRLAGNRTTGFGWALTDAGSDVLAQQGEPNYVPDPASANRVGAGGTDVWKFKAVRTGRHALNFEYRRAWEKGIAPARVVSYIVIVQ